VWLLLDRLDVAFAENDELEENALRALFKVYLDLAGANRIKLKIFLRSDIWGRLTAGGFREASHIIRHITIQWDSQSLLHLVVRRVLQNDAICQLYKVEPGQVLVSTKEQEAFFYQAFPDQVEVGPNKSKTFDWMLGRTRDGRGHTAPRELIHLLNASREAQLKALEVGEPEPEAGVLFSRGALKRAVPEVSKVRLEQTLYMESPSLRLRLQQLEREKTLQTAQTLAKVWELSDEEAGNLANQLVEVGFFELRGSKEARQYRVPFLYRDGLNMVQGSAE
jgi:hypothetical protein